MGDWPEGWTREYLSGWPRKLPGAIEGTWVKPGGFYSAWPRKVSKWGKQRRRGRKDKRVLLKQLTKQGTVRNDKNLKRFEVEFGRSNVIRGLVMIQDEDQRFLTLLELMLDPVHAKANLSTLLRKAGLKLMEVLDAMRRSNNAAAVAAVSQKAREILEDIARDSVARWEKCQECDGTGQKVTNEEVSESADGEVSDIQQGTSLNISCPACKGRKKVKVRADKTARDQFLEATGIIQRKGSTLNFNQQINQANVPGMNPFESTITRATKLLED